MAPAAHPRKKPESGEGRGFDTLRPLWDNFQEILKGQKVP